MHKSNIIQHSCAVFVFVICIAASVLLLIKFKDKDETLNTGDNTYILTATPISTDSTVLNNSQTERPSNVSSLYWMRDASLTRPRSNHGAVLLANGHIIVAGGQSNMETIIQTCDIYSLSTSWQASSVMKNKRIYHTLTPFANNTKILAAGSAQVGAQQTAEVYDSKNNMWTSTSQNMLTGRFAHAATLLSNGEILIIGGSTKTGYGLSNVEIYTPSLDSFTKSNSMNIGRRLFRSTLLNDGSTVLVTGGGDTNNRMTATAELYISGSWIFTNNNMTQPRAYHATVLLNDGNVLIAGGGDGAFISYSTAEIYNPITRSFTAVSPMKYTRGSFTLTLLPSGKVLATGGVDWTTLTYPVTCELYDPITQTWSNAQMLNIGRNAHQSILLADSVLTIGGFNILSGQTNTCEKYQL